MADLIFKNEDTAAVCSSLAFLLHAGITEADAINAVASDETRDAYRKRLDEMSKKADEGERLSEIFTESGCFEDYVCQMIKAGEETGKTEEALNSVAAGCENRARLDKQLKSALLYPAVLLLIMLAVIAVLLIYVLPVFDSVYSQLGSGLTGIAGGLLNVGKALKKSLPIMIAIFGIAVVFLILFASIDGFRNRILDILWKTKGEKSVSHKIDISRFARGLAMGLGSGMDIRSAIDMAAMLPDASGGMKERAQECEKLIAAGQTLSLSLGQTGLMPPSECRILEAGIKGGNSDRAMEQIASRLEENAEIALNTSVSKIEPVIVVICAILTGFILMSVMLPLVNIMSVIG